MKASNLKDQGLKESLVDFCGIPSTLVVPDLEPIWTKDNLFYRSIIIDNDTSKVLSCGFPKFFNLYEKSNLYPDIKDYDDIIVTEKRDGSLMICDYVNNKFSIRTRGIANYITQKNYKDFELLFELYPNVKNVIKEYNHISFLFEIETPNNVIVIIPSEVKFTFLGGIDKKELIFLSKNDIELLSNRMQVSTPYEKKYTNLNYLVEETSDLINTEGWVISYNNNQNRIKLKTKWYLERHRVLTGIKHFNHIRDLWIQYGCLDRNSFENKLSADYDWELVKSLSYFLNELFSKVDRINKKLEEIRFFLDSAKNCPRKEMAKKIIDNFDKWSHVVFEMLDGKKYKMDKLFLLLD